MRDLIAPSFGMILSQGHVTKLDGISMKGQRWARVLVKGVRLVEKI
jgi:hypothetical protein